MKCTFILALLCPLLSMCQPLSIKGNIVNEDSAPVSGASVTLKRTGLTILSNAAGEFIFTNTWITDSVIVSAVGYETTTVPTNERGLITVTLHRKIAALQEVMVSTGYQVMPKERTTGSFNAIGRELLNRRPGSFILDRLQDLAPGLLFNKSDNNLGTLLTIRGRSTLYANAEPLVVLDNFPYDGDLRNINPSDIESVVLLKDAAAAALWGARAGNGVIVITTKKGATPKPRVEFSSNFSFTQKPLLSALPLISSADYIELEKFLFSKGFYAADLTNPAHPPLTPVVELLVAKAAGTIPAGEADARIESYKKVDAREGIRDGLYRTGISSQHTVSLSGTTPVTNYYLSLGIDQGAPMLIGATDSRVSVNSRTTVKLTGKLEVSAGLVLTQRGAGSGNNPGYSFLNNGFGKSLYPYAQIAGDDGQPLSLLKDYRGSFIRSAVGAGLLNWEYNPISDIELTKNRLTITDNLLSTGLRYVYSNALSLDLRYVYETSTTGNQTTYGADAYFTRNLINQFTQVNTTSGIVTRPVPLGGIVKSGNSRLRSHQARVQLNFSKGWRLHYVSVLGGAEVKALRTEGSSATLYGYNSIGSTTNSVMDFITRFPRYDNTTQTASIPNGQSVSATTDRFVSFFINGAYSFKSRYTVSASAREDASNLFGVRTNQKGVPLWSVGGKWDMAKERFYKLAFLPRLSLRASYGAQGNISRSTAAYTTANYFTSPATGALAAEINNPPNDALRWEKVRTVNLGLDFVFSGNRFSGSIEYYRKNATDLMGRAPVDATLGLATNNGASSFFGNVASMKGSGIDAEVEARWLSATVSWSSNILWSTTKNKLTAYTMPVSAVGSAYISESVIAPVLGKPLFGIYSYRWYGLDGASGNPLGVVGGSPSADYATIINKTALDSMVFSGTITPTIFGALRNSIVFKNFSLSWNISYKLDYYFRSPSVVYNQLFSTWSGHSDYGLRWQKPGDEAITSVPSMVYPANSNRDRFYTSADVLVERGDQIRLEDLSLSYTWQRNGVRKDFFSASGCTSTDRTGARFGRPIKRE